AGHHEGHVLRDDAERYRRQPRGRDDEALRQPGRLSGGGDAVLEEPGLPENRHRPLGLRRARLDFFKSLSIAASGLKAQTGRMRIIAENIANADSTPSKLGENPYRRKIVTFQRVFDRQLEAN